MSQNLQQLQNTLFILEKEEANPEILQDLVTCALEIRKEKKMNLNFERF